MITFLNTLIHENSLDTWSRALAVFVLTIVLLEISKRIIQRRVTTLAKRTETDLDDLAAELIRQTKFIFLLMIALYLSTPLLTLLETNRVWIRTVSLFVLFIQVGYWGSGLLSYLVRRQAKEKWDEMDAAGATAGNTIGLILKATLWSILLILALDNIPGFEVYSLIASLGIGGIAVALAIQNILGDLFASITMVIDKPFVIGDYIDIGGIGGTVEHIGLKSTQLRCLSGEQLIVSNSDLLNSRVRNYKRMEQRRIAFSIRVTYQTPHEKLAAIPSMIREIIESHQGLTFNRAHFKNYSDSAIEFESVYLVKTPDFSYYMDCRQSINLALYKRFQEEGIEFAIPTQTIWLQSEHQKFTT